MIPFLCLAWQVSWNGSLEEEEEDLTSDPQSLVHFPKDMNSMEPSILLV